MAILRDDLLQGRTVAANVTGELREELIALGADVVAPPGGAEALVHDARGEFDGGGQDALLSTLERMWEAIVATANESLIASGRGGKIVLITPGESAGEHAAAARAAIENLARTLSTEWARYGITTTALTPRSDTEERDLAVLTAFLLSEAGGYYSGARFELGAS
jgi:NAD(P)-dependent dehydrogenase (short-subunit alcohol dehydrogenase family)